MRNLKRLLLLTVLLNSSVLYAQQDSVIKATLKELNEQTADSFKVKFMGRLSFAYQYVDFNKSFFYADSALRLAKKIDYKPGIAKSYNFLGLTYSTVGKLDLALENYLMALKINKQAGIERETAKNLNNIGETLVKIGDDKSAVKYIVEAYRINKKYGNKNSMAISLSLMSDVYIVRKEYKNAIEHLNGAREEAGNSVGIFDEGYYFTQLGEIYLKQGNVDSARIAFNKVLNSKSSESDQKIEALYGLSKLASDKGNNKLSEQLLNEALTIAKKSNARLELIRIYRAMSDLAYKTDNLKKSISYLYESNNLKDSLLGYQTSGQISGSLNKLITDQKESENEQLRLESKMKQTELSKQRTILITLVVGISILVLMVFLALFSYRSRNRAYQKLNIANETISKHSQELEEIVEKRTATITEQNEKLKHLAYFNSHNVRKHMANILGLIYLIKEDHSNKEYLDLVESEAKSLDETVKEINKMIDQ